MKWRNRKALSGSNVSFWSGARFLVSLLSLALGAGASYSRDLPSWNEIDLTASWRRVDFLLPLLARIDSNLPSPQLAATGVTADFQVHRHLTLTAGYLFAVLPQGSLNVHLPLVAVSPTLRLRRLVLVDRNRFEKLIGFGDSPVRYRNRFLLDLPFAAKERWHAFADDEVIFNINISAGNWNQNRLQFGGGRQLSSRLFLDHY